MTITRIEGSDAVHCVWSVDAQGSEIKERVYPFAALKKDEAVARRPSLSSG